MLTLVIWFVALVIGSSNAVESSQAQALDLNKILGLVQQLRLNNPSKPRILQPLEESSDSNSTSDSTSDSSSNSTSDSTSDFHSNSTSGSTSDSSSDSTSDDFDDNNSIAAKKIMDQFFKVIRFGSNREGKMNSHDKSDRSGDADNERLQKERIIDLIKTVSAKEKKKDDRIKNRKGKLKHGRNSYLFRSENNDSSNDDSQKKILEKLFSQTSIVEERQRKPKKRLKPNRLTPTVALDDVYKYYGNKNKNAEVIGLEDYSKVYIIFNPQAVKNSKNKNALNDLISKVLSLSSQTPQRGQQVDPFRYKGFIVNPSHVKRRYKEIKDNIKRMGDDENTL